MVIIIACTAHNAQILFETHNNVIESFTGILRKSFPRFRELSVLSLAKQFFQVIAFCFSAAFIIHIVYMIQRSAGYNYGIHCVVTMVYSFYIELIRICLRNSCLKVMLAFAVVYFLSVIITLWYIIETFKPRTHHIIPSLLQTPIFLQTVGYTSVCHYNVFGAWTLVILFTNNMRENFRSLTGNVTGIIELWSIKRGRNVCTHEIFALPCLFLAAIIVFNESLKFFRGLKSNFLTIAKRNFFPSFGKKILVWKTCAFIFVYRAFAYYFVGKRIIKIPFLGYYMVNFILRSKEFCDGNAFSCVRRLFVLLFPQFILQHVHGRIRIYIVRLTIFF